MTAEQEKTVESLASFVDALRVEPLKDQALGLEDDTEMVFEGEGIDGPVCGYINVDGTIDWIAGG